MIQSGCDLFENYCNEITCIYGEASTGKTTLAKLAAIELARKDKKVVYIDTENGFSTERVKQLANEDFQKVLENIILFRTSRFSEQNKIIKNLPEMKNISLIIIDTISHHYRVKVREKSEIYNMLIWKQFKILNEISKKIPVIITNQVYKNINKNNIEMIGGERFRRFSNRIIKLEKNPRRLILEKPTEKFVNFEVKGRGMFRLENKIN